MPSMRYEPGVQQTVREGSAFVHLALVMVRALTVRDLPDSSTYALYVRRDDV